MPRRPKEWDAFYVELGGRIRRARLARGVSQESLARAIGLTTRPHLCNIEQGRTNVYLHTVVAIAAALDVRPESLFAEHSGKTGKDWESGAAKRVKERFGSNR